MNFLAMFRGTAQPPPPPEAQTRPPITDDGVNPWTGLKDAVQRGWFNQQSGELFTGLPIGPDDVVADIGCGAGGNALFCARRGARLILIDVDQGCLDAAAAKIQSVADHKPFESHRTDSNPIPIGDESCTKVVCTEVLEHVDSPEQLMAELYRIGRPGARYLISCPTPNAEALQRLVAPPSYFAPPNHIRVIQADEFTRYVEQAGLIVEARNSHGFYQSIWWAMYWACDVPIETPRHPLLDNWSRTWQTLLDMPKGAQLKDALDDLMPKSQIIIARKP